MAFDFKMEVYTPALELVGMLNTWKSVLWEEKAFTAGSFSLDALITDEARELLIEDNILWIEGDTAGIIEHIEKQEDSSGPYITVKGRLLSGILDFRILWGQYDLSGSPAEIMHYLVNECCVTPTRGDTEARKIPSLTPLPVPSCLEPIQTQKTGGSLLDILEELGRAYGVAFGVRFNAEVPRMEFWTRYGVNRSVNQSVNDPVFYSTELDDVLASDYSYDSSQYRNIALVAGEGEGADRTYVVVEKDGAEQDVSAVGFVALGDSSPMRTSDDKPIQVLAITADGEYYQSAYTGSQIDEAIRRVLSGDTGGGNTSANNGLPTGGFAGQVLKKRSSTNYDAYWADESGGSGGGGDMLASIYDPQGKKRDIFAYVDSRIQDAISNLTSGGGIAVVDIPDPSRVNLVESVRQAEYKPAVDVPFDIEVLEE